MPIPRALALPSILISLPLHALALPALQGGGTPPAPVAIQLQYEPWKAPADPLYAETLANLIYPVGKGPQSLGYPPQALPVMLFFRGGNSNNIVLGAPLTFSEVPKAAKDYGFIGIDCNEAIIDADEDMTVVVHGLNHLIQYLRNNHSELNLSPERIFTHGRSAGTLVGYGVALREDLQDLTSPEPQFHWPSRPNYFIPRYGPSSMTCFSEAIGPWETVLSTFLFPGETFAQSTQDERLHASPHWWLLNPQVFGRTYTPPMCVVSFSAHGDTCGTVDDVHSGIFGEIMLRAIDDYADMTGDDEYRLSCASVDSSVYLDPILPTLAWSMARLADDYSGLHILPASGLVGASGGNITLAAVGGTGGSTVSFYSAMALAPQPLAGCPGALLELAAPVRIATDAASPSGLATITFSVPASVLGSTVYFQAVDHATCEVSEVEVHTYY